MQYIAAMTMVAAGATAQVRLPTVPLPALTQQTLPQTLDQVQSQSLDRLSALRRLEAGRLIRGNARVVDADPNGEPVVRNEILGLAPTDAALDHAHALGFLVDREQSIGAMNIRLVVIRAPRGMSTKKALRTLREADPGGSYDYNHIYSGGGATGGGAPFRSGGETTDPKGHDASTSMPTAANPVPSRVRVGLLDSGVDVTHPVFRESVVHAWGCDSRAVPAAHGTAVASLLIGRNEVFHGVHPDAEAAGFDKMTTIVEVELTDGTKVQGSADFGKGSPANPMTDAELADKFRQCAEWGGLDAQRAQQIIDLVWHIDELPDVNDLTRLLRNADAT